MEEFVPRYPQMTPPVERDAPGAGVYLMRMTVRGIEIKSRQIEDIKIKAGYLGALEVVKLIAMSQFPQEYQDVASDIGIAQRLMRGEGGLPGPQAQPVRVPLVGGPKPKPRTGVMLAFPERTKPAPAKTAPRSYSGRKRGRKPVPLTPEQNKALDLWFAGSSLSQIGVALSISTGRAGGHIEKGKRHGDPRAVYKNTIRRD